MALQKAKPTTPGQRFTVKVKHTGLHKGAPYAPLLEKKSNKQHYRVIDFKRNKDGIPGKVERLEYDPNRTAHLALVLYADGERRYIIAPKGVEVGTPISSGLHVPVKPGNTMPLRNIPVGTLVHCIEMKPGKGAQMMRSAGTSAQLAAREGMYAPLRLRSGEMRKIPADCRAMAWYSSNRSWCCDEPS